MPRFPQPFFRKPRNRWYVQIGRKQYNLGADKVAAFAEYHRLMARPPVEVDGTLVASILDGFLTWEKGKRAAATVQTHHWHIQRFLDALPNAATLTVAEFKPHHVKNWVEGIPDIGDTHRRNSIRAVKRAFSWALEYGYIDTNPISGLRCPGSGRRDKLILPETYQLMLARVRDINFRDLITMAWETGARPQELKKLEARHLEPDLARFHLPKDEAKGKKRARNIYLTDKALEIARRLAATHRTGPMFRNRKNKAWTSYAINCRMCRLKPTTGEKFALYDFRHSFAHRMLINGMDSMTVAELMGHSDLTMLKRVYGHLEKGTTFLRDRLKEISASGS